LGIGIAPVVARNVQFFDLLALCPAGAQSAVADGAPARNRSQSILALRFGNTIEFCYHPSQHRMIRTSLDLSSQSVSRFKPPETTIAINLHEYRN